MRFVRLPAGTPAGGAEMSILGFGCAALLGRASRKQSLRALSAALDVGITFFDTARSYGYGASEGLLGEFFAGKRSRAFLCTKFGIMPSAKDGWKQKVKPVARALVNAFPGLRKMAQQQAASQFVGGQFTVAALHTSLETSLRELRTDYVDVLLMHAAPASVLAQDDLLEALERLVESGKIRIAGISAEPLVITQYLKKRPAPLKTAQLALNLSSMNFVEQTRSRADLLLVANHPYGGPAGDAAERIERLCRADGMSEELRSKLASTGIDATQLLPELVLNCILSETGVSAVVPAMMQVRHIQSNVRALESCRFTPGELSSLREILTRNSRSDSA